ncbi:conserved hypothetical protein [Cellulomonas flavigena DSM 20109]|uniref:Antitoxin Xre/MbcA/ParS-like toxin-binding domain-containing protein n=1 Tax=Cellulomonas flavigena (strain ATCC 482 / DSM 20109 / BCRC 11376 / JCM 18109 / NBRC 3775 / NCIMB 8073 / NRS 134) TaxID=446466 RepID=D5UG07_CELFN|nr:hypothetical protein [Cellulomonas flavigena]ADG75030.1 conserved hypothetical protein [Cellulomonas flavigena DSM 20109]
MPVTTWTEAHAETTRMSMHELVRRLNALLGPTLVSTLAGAKDTKAATRWAKPDSGQIGPRFEQNLRFGYTVQQQIVSAENEHVARSWFLASNPLLDFDTPIQAVREGRHREVVRAANAVITDDWAG